MNNRAGRKVFTNIRTSAKNAKEISADMIIKKEVTGETKKRDGTIQQKINLNLNIDFWKNLKEPVSVVLDEAHAIMDPRTSMSKQNRLLGQWIALIRRVLGQNASGEGELVLITQLQFRLDVIAREMAQQIRYHIMHYHKICEVPSCGIIWSETSESPEPKWVCPRCGSNAVKKFNHIVEVWHFAGMEKYNEWKMFGSKTYHRHYLVRDIEDYFGVYNTLQWDNLFVDFESA